MKTPSSGAASIEARVAGRRVLYKALQSDSWTEVYTTFVVTAPGPQPLTFCRYAANAGTDAANPISAIDNVSVMLQFPLKTMTDCADFETLKLLLVNGFGVRLVADVASTGAIDFKINTADFVTLDLNGHAITSDADGRVFCLYDDKKFKLKITDSAGGGAIDGKNVARNVYGGFAYVGRGCALALDGGTIRNFKTTTTDRGGAAVYVDGSNSSSYSGGVFTMNGGSITNCTAVNFGGAVYLNNPDKYTYAPTFTMTGGTIAGNTAKAGGGIFNDAGKMTMTGGGIVGNVAETFGGGMHLQMGSTFAFEGGEISRNVAKSSGGGGICSSGRVTMTGGKLVGNSAPTATDATAFYSNGDSSDGIYGGVVEGTFKRENGIANYLYVYGGVYDRDLSSFCASGYACTKVGEKWVAGKSVQANDAGELAGAELLAFCPTNAEYVAAGLAVAEGLVPVGSDTSWVLEPVAVECATWAEVKANLLLGYDVKLTNDVSITSQEDALAVNYKLTSGKKYEAIFDLNGHTVDAYNGGNTAGEKDRVFILNGSAADYALTICDSAGGGAFVGHKQVSGHAGGFAFVADNCKLTLNGGTIRGFSSSGNGGAIALYATGTFEMNGGTITGCTANGSGGAVYCRVGKVTMTGGKIAGNSAPNDANSTAIYWEGGSSDGIYGGIVEGTVKRGSGSSICIYGGVYDHDQSSLCASGYSSTQVGSLYVAGKDVKADAGKLCSASVLAFCPTNAEYAAAGLALAEGSTVYANDDTWAVDDSQTKRYCGCGQKTHTRALPSDYNHVTNMWSAWTKADSLPPSGGNWYLTRDVDLTAEYVPTDSICIDLAGHVIRQTASNARVVNLKDEVMLAFADSVGGGKVTGGDAADGCGGCVSVSGEWTSFYMYGGSLCGNKAARGGAVYLGNASAYFYFYGGVIENNTASDAGGGIRVDGGSVYVYDAVVTNNAAASRHGGVSFGDKTSAKIYFGGATVVKDNHVSGQAAQNNVGFGTGCVVNGLATMPLVEGAAIGFTSDETPAAGAPVAVFGNCADGDLAYCTSDNPSYVVLHDANAVKLALSEADVVAKIGETPYSSVQYALNAVPLCGTATVKVVKDTKEDVVVETAKGVVIDLNGHALTADATAFTVQGNAALTLADSAAGGWIGGASGYGVSVAANGAFTMNGGAITNCADGAICAEADVDVRGGYFEANGCFLNASGTAHGNLYGGVWKGVDPTTAGGCRLMDGAQVLQVGDFYVVGKGLGANAQNELKRGVTTFCAANAEYAAGGFKLAEGCVSAYRTDTKPYAGYVVAKAADLAEHVHCLCGGASCSATHAKKTWTPWVGGTTLPDAAGDYYLVCDVDLAATYRPADGVRLCFNGKTVQKVNGGRVVEVPEDGVFTLTDCKTTGVLTGGDYSDEDGSGVAVYGEFDFFGGAITNNLSGSAVWMDTGKIVLGGRASVTNNPEGDLALQDGQTVEVSTDVPFAAGAAIGVTFYAGPGGSTLYVPVTKTNGADAVWFFADATNLYYEIVNRDDKVQVAAPIVTYVGMGGTFDGDGDAFADLGETILWGCSGRVYANPWYEDPDDPEESSGYKLTRPGYTFKGWGLSWSNNAETVDFEGAFLTNVNHTVYAHWESESVPESAVSTTLGTEETVGGVAVTGSDAAIADGALAIPDVTSTNADGKAVVKIAEDAFNSRNYDSKQDDDHKLNDVKIPTYVTEIGAHAFQKCASLTNVTFAPARDYATGAKTSLVIRAWAFKDTALTSVTFPADSRVVLETAAFADAAMLKDIYILGDVEVGGRRPFMGAGRGLAANEKLVIHLSPTLAADASFVYSLTNGMSASRVVLSQQILGQVNIIDGKYTDASTDPMKFRFCVKSDSPWLTVTEDTVKLFWAKDLDGDVGPYIGNEPVSPVPGSLKQSGSNWDVQFAKPEGSHYYQICVGE